MATATHSEATAAPAAAAPERRSAPSSSPRALPDAVLWMQKAAGNHAVARTMAPTGRMLQRCGANCGCTSCGGGHSHAEEELFDEQLGAGLLRTAVANRTI